MNRNIEKDAHEFGAHVKAGGWRLGLLVARNVERGVGKGGDAATRGQRSDRSVGGKISATAFAALATPKTTKERVLRYLDGWDRAAADGVVKPSSELKPGDEVRLDVDKLPSWDGKDGYYDASKAGGHNGSANRPLSRTQKVEHAKAALADPAVAAEVMSDPIVRRKARIAIGRQEDANAAGFEAEQRSRRQQLPATPKNALLIMDIRQAFGKVVAAATSAAKLYADRVADLDEEGAEIAEAFSHEFQGKIDTIFEAMRGDDLDAALTKILAAD